MYTKIYNSITEIEESKWDGIVGRNRIICTHRFLEAVEKSNINDCKYFYPVVYDNNKIFAHTCAYSISMELDVLANGIIKKIINIIRKIWKNFLIIQLMECGTPIALGNTISFSEEVDKKIALSLLINEIENMAKVKKIGIIIIRDFYDDEIHFFNNLTSTGYKRVYNLPNTILKIKWDSFDNYLDNLKSYYRSKILKKINMSHQSNLVIEITNKYAHLADQLETLWHNTYNNAKEYRREILTKDFFINFNNYFNNESKVILFRQEGKIVGFSLVLKEDDVLIFMFSGLDYTYNKESAIYFNCLYSVIRLAIQMQLKKIDMGLTTYDPKTDVGAKMVKLYIYMKHTNKLLNPIITNIFATISPKIKLKLNNIFKEKSKKLI